MISEQPSKTTRVAEQKEDPQKVADLQKVETLKVRVWVGLLQLKGGGREGNAHNGTMLSRALHVQQPSFRCPPLPRVAVTLDARRTACLDAWYIVATRETILGPTVLAYLFLFFLILSHSSSSSSASLPPPFTCPCAARGVEAEVD